MNISVNGNSQSFIVDSVEDFKGIWKDITERITEGKELIQSVYIDGKLTGDYSENIMSDYNNINLIEIMTISAERSYYSTLNDLRAYMVQVLSNMENYMEPLYSANQGNCAELPIIVESLEWIITSTNYLDYLSSSFDICSPITQKVKSTVSEFNRVLVQLNAELVSENLVGFADIVQYEFLPAVQEFYNAAEEVEYSEQNLIQ